MNTRKKKSSRPFLHKLIYFKSNKIHQEREIFIIFTQNKTKKKLRKKKTIAYKKSNTEYF
jgi:hypothetical protein